MDACVLLRHTSRYSTVYSFNMRIFLLIISLIFTGILCSQSDQQVKEYEEQYSYNIEQTHLNGVYIPESINDAITELDRLSNEAGRSKFLETDEDNAAKILVKGLGKWMMVNWNLFEGSRLSHLLKGMGVSHPEDMAKFLIVSYHRHLRDAPQDFQARAKMYEEQRKSDQIKRNAEKKVITSGNH